jgi:uncharacterized coiled-coil protein SlyX
MNHEAALIELAAAVARLSDSVEATARLLNTLCDRMADVQADPPAAAPASPASAPFRVIEGGRSATALLALPPPD